MEVSNSWEASYGSTIWMRNGSVGGDSSQRMMACMFGSIRLSRLYRRDGRKHGEQQYRSKVSRQSVGQRQAFLGAAIVRRDGIRHD